MAISDINITEIEPRNEDEIRKQKKLANDESRSPAVRIAAARKLLKESRHSDRAQRVAKRIAKLYMTKPEVAGQEVSLNDRKAATRLFQFCLDRKVTPEDADEPETSESFLDMFAKKSEVPKKSHAEQLAEKNADWNVYKYNPYLELALPERWIYYRTLEDLAAYNIPADPRLLKGGLLETLKLFIDGDLYYIEPDLWWNKVSNPLYLKALNGRKVNWSGCRVDTIDADGEIIKNTDGQIS
jgi:hypothetical protein